MEKWPNGVVIITHTNSLPHFHRRMADEGMKKMPIGKKNSRKKATKPASHLGHVHVDINEYLYKKSVLNFFHPPHTLANTIS